MKPSWIKRTLSYRSIGMRGFGPLKLFAALNHRQFHRTSGSGINAAFLLASMEPAAMPETSSSARGIQLLGTVQEKNNLDAVLQKNNGAFSKCRVKGFASGFVAVQWDCSSLRRAPGGFLGKGSLEI